MKLEAFPTLLYRYHIDDQDDIKARVEAVSYTHLTLPTNREV